MKFRRSTALVLATLGCTTMASVANAGDTKTTGVTNGSSKAAEEKAQREVTQAESLYQSNQFSKALSHFEAAYQLMEGHSARHHVLNNIALCEERLLRIDAAIATYERYLEALSTAPAKKADSEAAAKHQEEVSSVKERIERLKSNSGYLKVAVNPSPGVPTPPISISVDGQLMPAQDEYRLPTGEHVIEMKPDGIDGQKKVATIATAEHQELSFELIDPYKEAKERVHKAEQLYETGNYDAALTEFKQAYENMVGHPARPYVLYNVARCQERLYRYDAAVASYKEYLEIASEDEADRPKVEATIESLEGFLGTISITVTPTKGGAIPSYEVWVDGHLVGADIKKFLIPGGTHQVEIRAEGFEGATREIQVPSRAERSAEFALAPLAKEYKGISTTYFYTAAGLTVATAAAGTAFGIMTLTSRNKVDDKEPEAVTQQDADRVKKNALYADIFFISAGVFATSATILAFLTDWSPEEPPVKSGLKVNDVGLMPIEKGGYLSLGGTFSW